LKKKAVISIGCGESQLLVIQAAIEIGFSVIGLDKNENAIGRVLCDEFCCRSTHELKDFKTSLMNYIDIYEIVGILNRSSGIPVIAVAEVSKYLKLSYYSTEIAETVVNKHKFFTFLRNHNFASPSTQIRSKDAIISGDIVIKYPCLVKPSLSTVGKSGIYKVNSSAELEETIQKSFESTENEHLLIQNYLEGKDVAMISMVIDGQLHVYEIIEEVNSLLDEKIRGIGVLTPARINVEQRNELINTARVLAKKLNIINSPFMLSFLLQNPKV
jgi:biotin carboxylase